MRRFILLAALLSVALPAHSQVIDNSAELQAKGLFPFALPPFDGSDGPTNVAWLNEKPAGKHGFVSVQGEHFLDGAGKQLRFWGVNLNFNGIFPPKEMAPQIAARLAKFGFNAVRIHHYEGNVVPTGLWQPAAIGSSRILIPRVADPDQLDRMDFLINELIKQGIYVDLNLHVARKVTEAEGFPNATQLPEKDKGMADFYPQLTEAQKAFDRFMLTHVNSYTGLPYKDEPGICCLEVANENSLLQLWLDGTLGKIPSPYAEDLTAKWNGWLKEQYGFDSSLRQAWTEWSQPLGSEDLLAVPLPPAPTKPQPTPPPSGGSAFTAAANGVTPLGNNPNNVNNGNVGVLLGAPGTGVTVLAPATAPDPTAPVVLAPPAPAPPAAAPPAPGTVPPNPADQPNVPPATVLPGATPGTVPGAVPPPEPVLPPAPVTDPAAVLALRRFSLATVGGGVATTILDENSGPVVDGVLQPALVTDIDTVGSVSWAFQINRDGINLAEGQGYTVTFMARADSARRMSVNFWQDKLPFRFLGFTGYADLTREWQTFSFSFRPVGLDGGKGRLAFNLGNQLGQVQIGAIAIHTGGAVAAPENWNLREGVPLINGQAMPLFQVRRDFARFLGSLEAAHAADMRQFLKGDLGVKVPLWETQVQFGGWGGVLRESVSDVVDNHAYWKHPDFAGGGWTATNWHVDNQSMTGAPANDPLSAFAFSRLRGKPYVMTEWNTGQPNDYGSESLLMAASYAASQDWGGIWLFDYHSSGSYDRDHFEGFFSIDSVPVKMVTAPVAALLFRRPTATHAPADDAAGQPPVLGDQAAAMRQTTLILSRDQAWDDVANMLTGPGASPYIKTWTAAGSSRSDAMDTRVGVELSDGLFPSPTVASLDTPTHWKSTDSFVCWDGKRSLWKVDTPRTKLAAGNIGSGVVCLSELRLESSTKWASCGLVSLDGESIPASRSMLLVLAGRTENIGMKWNADRTSVANDWGKGPVYAEGVSAFVRLASDARSCRVWALDEKGQKREKIPCELHDGAIRFEASPAWGTLWYLIETN